MRYIFRVIGRREVSRS